MKSNLVFLETMIRKLNLYKKTLTPMIITYRSDDNTVLTSKNSDHLNYTQINEGFKYI